MSSLRQQVERMIGSPCQRTFDLVMKSWLEVAAAITNNGQDPRSPQNIRSS